MSGAITFTITILFLKLSSLVSLKYKFSASSIDGASPASKPVMLCVYHLSKLSLNVCLSIFVFATSYFKIVFNLPATFCESIAERLVLNSKPTALYVSLTSSNKVEIFPF